MSDRTDGAGMRPASRFVERDGLALHHLDWGNEGRHPLLLVHGSRLHAHVWNDFSRRVKDRYHVLAVDQRGHGDSGWGGEGGYALEDYYEDLRAVVAARGLGRFTLIGHSLGGRVAMLYAHRHPEQLERLVLVDITPGRSTPMPAGSAQPQAAREFDTPDAASAYLARLMSRAPRHLLEESAREGLKRTAGGRYVWKYDPMLFSRRAATVDLWEAVRTISAPTLLQYGSESDVVDAALAARLAAAMPRCTVERIESAGHGLFTDQPDAFAASVSRFLGD